MNDGDFVTVIGGNGAVKSTLLNMIVGVYPMDSGKIILNDVDITLLPEFKRASLLAVYSRVQWVQQRIMQIEENFT